MLKTCILTPTFLVLLVSSSLAAEKPAPGSIPPGPTPAWVEVDAAPAAVPAAPAAVAPEATAPAAPVILPPDTMEKDPAGWVEKFVGAVKDRNFRMLGSLFLILIMFGLTKLRSKVAWFKGDRGGAILVMLLGLAGGFAAALQSGAALDLNLVLGTMGVVWTAVGGVTFFKKIIWPKDDEEAKTA